MEELKARDRNEFEKKNKNVFKILFVILSIILVLPSIKYLIRNKTLANFNLFNTWILEKMPVGNKTLIDAICFALIFIALIFIYIELLKKDSFKSIKRVLIFIAINSVIFGVAIPYMTSDIFYYLGIGWLDSNYHENPYYTTVSEKMQEIHDDEILNSTGYWSDATCVYGPTWELTSKILSKLSFGCVTLGIYIFKLAAIIVHVLNCFIIYKICKKKKFVLMYGLNPIILFHMITNVHNDVYVVLFLLLTIYFAIRRKNIWLALTMLAISVTIKYLTILFFPFLVLYFVQDKKIGIKFLYGLKYFVFLLILISVPYLFYIKDPSILKAMLIQGDKYSQSIWCFILIESRKHMWNIDIDGLKTMGYIIFIGIYLCLLIKNLFVKKLKFREIMEGYNLIVFLFIFLVLSTFQVWYLVWLMPGIMYQKKKNIIFYNNLILTSIIPLGVFIYRQSDGVIYGMWQSMAVLVLGYVVSQMEDIIKMVKVKKIK